MRRRRRRTGGLTTAGGGIKVMAEEAIEAEELQALQH